MTDLSATQAHQPPTYDDRLGPLRQMKLIALSFLLAAIAGLALAIVMGGQGGWGWLRAFSEAAAVGAIADWFAVVALFRHPLGLPIPHTAIIPNNKDRIADNLAIFVRDHFLEPKALLAKLSVFDPAARLSQWMTEPERVKIWVDAARLWGLESLNWLDDARLQQAFKTLVLDALHRWDAAKSAGQILTLLTRDGRHQELLDESLEKIGAFLSQDDVKKRVSALMVRYARQEWPAITAMVDVVKSVDALGDAMADKLGQALLRELQEILQQPDHPVRLAYGEKVEDFIRRLRADPALVQRVQDIKAQLIDHPGVHTYVDGLVTEVKAWLRRDLSRQDSRLGQHLYDALTGIGIRLSTDASLRQSINEHILSAAAKLVHDLRDGVTEHITHTIKDWDEAKMVREMEINVGKDLQFIRLNGTLVGGLIGLVLYGLGSVLTWLLPLIH